MEFACHAFLPAAIADMEAMGSHALSHNISYTTAQAMFYLVAGAHRIQPLGEIEVVHAVCGAQETSLKHQIVEIENDVRGFE